MADIAVITGASSGLGVKFLEAVINRYPQMDDEGGKKILLMLFLVYWIPMRDVVMDLESFPCEKVVCVLSLQKNSEGMKFSLSNKVT